MTAPLSREAEPDGASGMPLASPFGRANADAVTLATAIAPPVTVITTSNTDALTATPNGFGRAIAGLVNNAGSGASAFKGQTSGSGAGVTASTWARPARRASSRS